MRFHWFGPPFRLRTWAVFSLLASIAIWYGTTFHNWLSAIAGLPWGGFGFDDFGLSVFNANDYAGPDTYFRIPHVAIVAAAVGVCLFAFRRPSAASSQGRRDELPWQT